MERVTPGQRPRPNIGHPQGFSALACPKRLSIHAWSVGVRGRPRRWATASAAKRSRVARDVIWGPLSEQASGMSNTKSLPYNGRAC